MQTAYFRLSIYLSTYTHVRFGNVLEITVINQILFCCIHLHFAHSPRIKEQYFLLYWLLYGCTGSSGIHTVLQGAPQSRSRFPADEWIRFPGGKGTAGADSLLDVFLFFDQQICE